MSVYKPQGKPHYLYDFQWQGHRYYGSTFVGDRPTAKALEAAIRRQVVVGEHYGKDREMTLDIAGGRYFAEVSVHQTTAETTGHQLERLGKHLGKDTRLSDIDGSAIARYIATRRGHISRTKRRLAPASINREVELLRRVIYRARDVWGVKVGRVGWKALRLKEAPPPDHALTDAEEARLLDEAADYLVDPIRFSLLTGLRKSNVFTLDWSQIDMHGKVMTLRVKGGKMLRLPLSQDAFLLLANLGPKDTGPVFTRNGQPIGSIKTAWNAALRRAGIRDFRWHDLRHTFGSRMVASGVDISLVQDLMGHSSITTTRRYVHHHDTSLRDALERLNSRRIPDHREGESVKPLKKKGD